MPLSHQACLWSHMVLLVLRSVSSMLFQGQQFIKSALAYTCITHHQSRLMHLEVVQLVKLAAGIKMLCNSLHNLLLLAAFDQAMCCKIALQLIDRQGAQLAISPECLHFGFVFIARQHDYSSVS